jgi:hypothetical protein
MAREGFEKGYIPADYDYTENTSTRSVISTEIVQKFSTAHDWSLLRRDPIRFFKVYGYLLKRPVILREIAYRTFRRFAGRVFAQLSGRSSNRLAAPQT